ncbi:MAG TPA: glycoside hydrolase family 27 protein [Galbitalea sp.]|jgi:alpha-galactosidase
MRAKTYWSLFAAAIAVIGVVAGPAAASGAAQPAAHVTFTDTQASSTKASYPKPTATAKADAAPPMGWNSYNAYACDNGAENMEAVAKFIHTSGLEADGYRYVNTDGCYDDLESLGSPNTYGITAPTAQDPETCGAINGRLPDGELFANAYDFPPSAPCANDGLALVGDDLHSLGLKLGVYLDASNNWNCEEIPGSYGFDATDANTLAADGADYVKIDWGCGDTLVPPASSAPAGYTGVDAAPGNQGFGGPTFATNPAYDTDQQTTQTKYYTALIKAIRTEKRPITVSVAGAGTLNSQVWALPEADLVRPTGDANANFTATGRKAAGSIVGIVNSDAQTYDALTGPGHWIDPDAMEVGNGAITPAEDRSEMSMFSEMADPLLMSTNLCAAACGPDTTPATKAQLALAVSVFGNKNVIAIDQDSLGSPAHIVGSFDGTHLTMAKPLANGDVAVTLFNESTTDAATMATTVQALGLPAASKYQVEDLWTGAKQTSTTGAISASVAPTETVMYRISPIRNGHAAQMTVTHAKSTSAATPTASSKKPATTSIPANLVSVSCTWISLCTGVDNFGAEVTFNPNDPRDATTVEIAPGRSLVSVSCSSATGQCTALDRTGDAYTFSTTNGSRVGLRHYSIDRGGEPTALACIGGMQCTVVDGKGAEITFSPVTGKINHAGVRSVDPYTYLASVACPSATQCTAGGGGGNNGDTEVSFNPVTGAVGAAGVLSLDAATVNGVSSVACPSLTECVVVDGSGNEITFDPSTGTPTAASPAPLEGADLPGGLGVMTSVSCDLTARCTAVDDSGIAVVFDPTTGAVTGAGLRTLDANGSGLQSLTCSKGRCVAVDLGGRALSFGETSPSVTVGPTLVSPAVRWTPRFAV